MQLLKRAAQVYETIVVAPRDPRILQWPLMGSLFYPLGIIAIYVWFVKSKGPELMANRKAFNLKWLLVAFNASQVLVNAYFVYLSMSVAWLDSYSLRCQPVDYSWSPKPLQIAFGCYLYFVVKLVDLLDTVFYVLRKRDRQISFLHVYHHSGMVLLSFNGVSYFPGGNSLFLGTINSFVHMVMYTYYLSTALRPTFHNRVWWKKYLTQLQMVQFLLVILHTLQLLWEDCGYPRWVAYVLVPQNCFMLMLFADFYRHNYGRQRPPAAPTAVTAPAPAPAKTGGGDVHKATPTGAFAARPKEE